MEQQAQNSNPEPRKGGFKKGVSGNPGGRPKAVKELQELARDQTAAAVKVLVNGLKSADERVQQTAAKELLDRGWGKAPQAITGPEGESLKLGIYIDLGGK